MIKWAYVLIPTFSLILESIFSECVCTDSACTISMITQGQTKKKIDSDGVSKLLSDKSGKLERKSKFVLHLPFVDLIRIGRSILPLNSC